MWRRRTPQCLRSVVEALRGARPTLLWSAGLLRQGTIHRLSFTAAMRSPGRLLAGELAAQSKANNADTEQPVAEVCRPFRATCRAARSSGFHSYADREAVSSLRADVSRSRADNTNGQS